MGYIRFSELPTTSTSSVDKEDYMAVLDTSSNVLKKSVVDHATEKDSFGLGTVEKYGHNKVIDDLNAAKHADGEALSAHQGHVLASDLGFIEDTDIAKYEHEKDDYFIFKGEFVHCTAEPKISVGDTIQIGTNVESTNIGSTLLDFKKSFQAGVRTVYDACTQSGISPSSSTPDAISTAIRSAASGTAREGDVANGKTFLAGNAIRTGSYSIKVQDNKTATAGTSAITVNPDTGYNYMSKVTVNPTPSIWSTKRPTTRDELDVYPSSGQLFNRYTIDLTNVPNENGDSYNCPTGWNGTTAKDMGVDNKVRWITAYNVYNYGFSEGIKSGIGSLGSGLTFYGYGVPDVNPNTGTALYLGQFVSGELADIASIKFSDRSDAHLHVWANAANYQPWLNSWYEFSTVGQSYTFTRIGGRTGVNSIYFCCTTTEGAYDSGRVNVDLTFIAR